MRIFILQRQAILSVVGGMLIVVNFLYSMPMFAGEHALLVGCSQYVHLPQGKWLKGPENDVKIIENLLTDGDVFEFDSEHITTLAGWPDDETLRPTRANIEREFTRLAEVVGQGDQVVIFLAGHGSQQPANDDPDDLERDDGFDEIFLPADVGQWNGEKGRVENAIMDDDIRAWLTAIQEQGAFVWIIVDACHSGSMIRGKEQERERFLSPEEFGIPEQLIEDTHRRFKEQLQARGMKSVGILDLPASAKEIVALYAAQSTETTVELPLPPNTSPQQTLGLFTYTLAGTLYQSMDTSYRYTYRELVAQIHARYRSSGRFQPTPVIEGGALDREVLGTQEWTERPDILLGKEDASNPGLFELKMGSLHGLHPGSILEVYPPAGAYDAEKIIGHVRVETTFPLNSLVKPVEFADMAAPVKEQLQSESRCKIVFREYGDLRLKIAVQRRSDNNSDQIITYSPGEGPDNIEAAFQNLLKDDQFASLVERVADAADADWLIRVICDQIVLIPASGFSKQEGIPPQFNVATIRENGQQLTGKLETKLLGITKATNLMYIATGYESSRSPDNVNIQLELLRIKDDKQEPVAYTVNGRTLYIGEQIIFRIVNQSEVPVDVTLLFIDSSYGIYSYFPLPGKGENNRLPPGKMLEIPDEITSDSTGEEYIVAIAVKAGKERIDFSCLEQPTLAMVRSNQSGESAMDSSLGQLLKAAMYGERTGQGIDSEALEDYAVHLLSWRTLPAAE